MKKILVPFDYSLPSRAALDLAVNMAGRSSSGVNLLYVIPDVFAVQNRSRNVKQTDLSSTNVRKFLDGIRRESLINLKEIIKQYKNSGVKIFPIVELSTSIYQGILRYISKNETSFTIMGTHGASNIKKRFIGTNTERVFRMTKKPVLIVRDKITDFDFSKIVFASNLERSYRKVFSQAWKFIKLYDAKVEILRVNTIKDTMRGSYAIGAMKSLTRNYKADFDFVLVDADTPEEGISRYCDKSKAGLLIIGVHRKKGFKRLFTDRVSESITRTSNLPILTIDISD